jgi:hypothetical protein
MRLINYYFFLGEHTRRSDHLCLLCYSILIIHDALQHLRSYEASLDKFCGEFLRTNTSLPIFVTTKALDLNRNYFIEMIRTISAVEKVEKQALS